MTKIQVRASITSDDYVEGTRPPLGPPYRVQAKEEHYGQVITLTTRPTYREASKVARAIRKMIGGS